MDREEKIKVAITAGIAGVILLILILYLALSGMKKEPENDNAMVTDTNEAVTTIDSKETKTDDKSIDTTSDENLSDPESKSENSSKSEDGQTTNETEVKQSAITKKTVSGNSLYKTEQAELRNNYKGLAIDIDAQMEEMASYWSDGNMDAVRDLAHLDRFEAMSYKLNGTKDFYYFGDVNGDGAPEGKGLACYANDQYYYGDWSNGVRSGDGTWISFYPDYDTNVVIEHLYAGDWAQDLPNGEGQEHYDYDQNYMNDSDIYVQNAIGTFSDALYNGRMYMITVNNNYETKEWYGNCENGTWKQIINSYPDKEGRIAVMDEKDNAENHIWMYKEKITGNGINGIITGGKMVTK